MYTHRSIGRRAGSLLGLVGALLLCGTAQAQNVAPSISGTPPTTATPGVVYSFTPTASDPNGDRLAFTASGTPQWAGFDRKTGRLSGRPSQRHAGLSYSVQISVSDGKLSASLPRFTITVGSVSTPGSAYNGVPTISGTPSTSVAEGELYGFVPTASDPNGDRLKFSVAGKPAWASFTPSSGLLSGIPPAGTAGNYPNIVISVSDGTSTVSLPAFGITVSAKPNSAPSIWGVPATSVDSGNAYSFRPSASDPDGQTLRFSVQGLPSWASFDTASGALGGTPSSLHVGTYTGIVITVSDGVESSSLSPFSITVAATNRPPVITGSPSASVTAGQAYGFSPSASDPDGQPLTFSISNKPAWATFDTASGRLSGTPTTSHVGAYSNIVISVSDGQASASLGPFSITVAAANRPPVITGTPSASVTAGQAYGFTPTASDPDGQPLTFSISSKPAWASFSSSTGRLSGTPDASRAGTYSGIVISVSDGTLSSALPAFSLTVLAEPNGSATVSWTPPTTNEDGSPLTDLAGFRVVYGQSADALSSSVNIPSAVVTSATIQDLAPGTWYFAVKAYTAASVESNLSQVGQKMVN